MANLPVKHTALPAVRDVQEMAQLASYFEQSGMFGCSQQGQGMVVLMTCLSEGISPLQFIDRYHLIKGRPTVKADAMLARFHELGGRHRIVRRTPDCAAIHLEWNGAVGDFTLTWDDAAQCDFPYSNKTDAEGNKILKDNWRSPRGRMQMLWARVVSDGIGAICPGAKQFYTPEETVDFTPGATYADIPPDAAEIHADTDAAVAVDDQGGPEADPGFLTLPIGANAGRPWTALTTDQLNAVLAYQGPEITPTHKAMVRLELSNRNNNQEAGNGGN